MSCHHGVSTVNGSSWPSTVPSSSQATRVTTRSIGAIMPGADGACSTDNSCGPRVLSAGRGVPSSSVQIETRPTGMGSMRSSKWAWPRSRVRIWCVRPLTNDIEDELEQ